MKKLLLLFFSLMFYVNGWGQCNVNNAAINSSEGNRMCLYDSTNFTISGLPNGSTVSWTPAVGLNSTSGTSVNASPLVTTTYTATITCSNGSIATLSRTITIDQLPQVSINTTVGGNTSNNPNSIIINCGQSVILSGSGVGGNNDDYDWLFPNNPNDQTITVNPTQTTSYFLVGTNNNGCSDTDTIVINVTPLNNASFTFTPNNVCSGTPIQFTNTTIGSNLNYSWNFNDGTSNSSQANPVHIFNSTGVGSQTFNVTLTVTPQGSGGGCSRTVTQPVTIFKKPDAAIADYNSSPTPFTNCGTGAYPIIITNISSGNIDYYSLDWGDGSPISNIDSIDWPINTDTSHTYQNPGFFTITLIAFGINGCNDTSTYDVFNGTNPGVGLVTNGSTILKCIPSCDTIFINYPTTNIIGTTYTISFNDGTPNLVFNHPPPQYFIHCWSKSSCGASGGTTPNTFYIKCRVENQCGFFDDTKEPYTTITPPEADFSITPDTINCINSPVTFTNTSFKGDVVFNNGTCDTTSIINWTISPSTGWSIISGTTGTINPNANPLTWGSQVLTTSFQNPGLYTIKLIVRNASATGTSCRTDTIIKTICIVPPPIPIINLQPDSGCAPLNVSVNNNTNISSFCALPKYLWTVSYIPANCGTTPSWSFITGDSTSFAPTFNFVNPGLYIVKFSITNPCGTFNDSDTVIVKAPPIASFTIPPSICVNQSVNLTTTFQDCGDSTRFFWTIPGGNITSSTAQNPGAVTFANPNTYIITDSVVNSCGAVVLKDTLVVFPLPVPIVRGDTICVGQQAIVVASGGTSYLWSDGSTNDTIFVSPTTIGFNTYTVTVTNANSCSAVVTDTVKVNPLPAPVATGSTVCSGLTTTINGSGGGSYLWSTGATTQNVNVTLTTTSTYTLTVTNSFGCTATDTAIVNILSLPIVNAGPSITLCNQPIPTTLTGFSPSGGTWSGTGVTSIGGVFTPNGLGVFVLTYTYTDGNGCTNNDTMRVTVITPQIAIAGTGFRICQSNTSINLTGFSPAGGTWSGTNVTPTGVFTPSQLGLTILTYSYGAGTCLNTDTIQVTVDSLPIMSANGGTICSGQSFSISGTGLGSYLWSTSAITQNINVSPSVGSNVYTLTVTNSYGCSSSDTAVVLVNPLPTITNQLFQNICSSDTTTSVICTSSVNNVTNTFTWNLISASTNLSGYFSTPPGGFVGNLPAMVIYNSSANLDSVVYSVFATANGCQGNLYNYIVYVLPAPQVTISAPNDTICSGDQSQSVTLSSQTTNAVITWSAAVIAPGVITGLTTNGTNSISSQTFVNNSSLPIVIDYTISIVTGGGTACPGGTQHYYVVVNPKPNVTFNPATQTICSGSSTTPIAISSSTPNTTISWTCTPHSGISGAQSSGTGSTIPAQTLVNSTSAPITVYYVAEAVTSVGLCPGKKDSAAVIVNPIPLAIANPVSDTICSATSTNIALTSDVTGATFTWSSVLGDSISVVPTTGSGSTISQTLTNNGTDLDSVVYTITPRANNCDGLPIDVTVYVQPIPKVTFSAPNQVLCDSSTTAAVTLNSTVSNVVYSWSLNANGITGFTTNSGAGTIPSETIYLPANSTNTVTATYSAQASIGGCPGPDSLYKVTLFPIPRMTGSLQQIICSDTSSSVVNWSNNVNAGLSVSYNWNIINSATTTLTGFLPTTSGYGSLPSWLLNNPTANNDTLFIQVTPSTHPTATDSCEGIPFIYQLVVNPSPQVDLSAANDTICSGDASQVVLLSSATTTAIITWSASVITGNVGVLNVSSGTTTIPSQVFNNSGTAPAVVEYTIKITTSGGGCNGGTRKYYVVVNPTPAVTFNPATQTICSGSSTAAITISSTTPNTTISWTCTPPSGISGAQSSGTGSTIPAQTLVNSTSAPITVYYVAEAVTSVGLCPGKKDSAAVIVNPIPLAIANPASDTICSVTSTNIALTSDVTGATFTWSSVLGDSISLVPTTGSGSTISQTLTNNGTDLDSVVYSITPRANNCDGLPIDVTVYVQPIPKVTFSAPNQVLCDSSTTSAITLSSTVSNVVYSWSLNANGITGFTTTSGAGTIPSETIYLPANSTNTVTATYSSQASIGGCPGPDSLYKVTLFPIPRMTGSLQQIMCSDTLSAAVTWTNNLNSALGVTYNWQVANNSTSPLPGYTATPLTGYSPISGYGNLPSWLLNNPTANNETLYVQVIPYSHPSPTDSCDGIPFIYQIIVNPSPQVDISANDTTICSGGSSQAVTLSSQTTTAIITWTALSSSSLLTGLTTVSGTTTIPTEVLTNNDSVSHYIEYIIKITTAGGGCNGGTKKYYVYVNPTPTVTFNPAAQTICSGSSTAPITISSTTPNTTISWTCTPPSGISGAQTSGTGSTIPAQTLVNSTSAPITVYYVAEAVTSVGLCPGKKDSAAVIVNPIPLAIANPVSDTICSATSTNIALTSDVIGATFTWSSVLGDSISVVPTTGSGSTISQTLTNNGTDLDSVVYTITPRANNCDGLPIDVTAYVQPIPKVTFSAPNQVLCDSSTTAAVTLNSTVSNVVYSWSLNSNGITGFTTTSGSGTISSETIFLPAGAITNVSAIYTANASIDGCPGPDSLYSVTLYPIANITGPANQTICSGQNITSVNWQSNVNVTTTYNWHIINSFNSTVIGYPDTIGFDDLNGWTLFNPNPPNPNPDSILIQVIPYTHPTPTDSCQGIPFIYTIIVNPAPSVILSTSNDTICSGEISQVVTLSSQTSNAIISWNAIADPQITGLSVYSGSDTIYSDTLTNTDNIPHVVHYTINIITSGTLGCPGIPQHYYVVVNPSPLVTFNQPNQVICSGSSTLPVTINTTSPNTVISWSCNPPAFISGLTATTGNDTIPSFNLVNNSFNPITITFAAWGTTTSENCVGDTNYYTITVNPIPPAFASPSDTTICSNTVATIQLSSPVGGTTFNWTYVSNPFITGASNGSGSMINQTLINSDILVQTMTYLITPNASNCPGSPITALVHVNPSKPVVFNPGNQSLCSNETSIPVYLSSPIDSVTFSWTCTPPAGITGTISSGTDSIPSQNLFSNSTVVPIPVIYNAIATYDGCPGPSTPYTITVNPTPVPSFTLDTVICKNVAYVFGNTTSTTASTTYLWDFGDGVTSTTPSPSHAYNAGGIYTITLSATNQYGCDSSYTRTVKVVEPPVAQFVESPREGCGPLSVTFTDQSTGYLVNPTYNWNFGNGTTANTQGPHTVVFNASLYQDTLYLVTQTVGNLCGSTTYIDSVIVHPTPTAYFGTNLSSGCSPLTISFSNNSYGLPTSFLWSFGDGTTDTSRVPAPHTFYAYTQDTVYYISLIAINDCGTNTYVDSVLVHPNTTNAFFNTSPDKGCAPLTVTFTNYSIGGTIYAWDFGDGNVSNQYNTTHTYINPGIYTASFIITNNCSYDTAYVSIEVWPQPTLSFTSSVDTICINSAVQFNNTSATPLTNIVWDFGDGTSSVLSNPSHTYLNAGTFLVSMIGTGGPHGCSDTTYKYIVVKPLPIAAYDSLYFEGCQPFVANFINQSTGGVSGVLWDFGDGNTSAAFNATHVYLNAGIFYPLLTVQTQYGCVDTARGEVIVHPKPTSLFTFSPDSSCGAPIVVQFNNQSVLGSGANWSFTDGQTSTQISPAMTFTQVGTLGVQLIAISDFGCKDTSSDQFVVYPKPIADIAVVDPRGCEDFTPVFINNSTNAISYSWTFGDGFTSTDQLPVHTYTEDGNYIVTLAIEGLGGCKDSTTLSSTITVIPGPTADFSYTPALNPTNYGWIYFTNLSVYDVSWHWNFDDGSNSTLENPDHQYNANGVYNVELIAYAANGCTDTIVKPIKPTYFDGLFVPNAFAPDKGNNGDMYRVFYPQGKSLSSYHVWVYDTFGILIWESTALKNGSPSEWWDGTRDGSLLPSDVYIWKVEATFENGDIWPGQFNPEQGLKRITGNVTLIR
jgi:PKD repeat protein